MYKLSPEHLEHVRSDMTATLRSLAFSLFGTGEEAGRDGCAESRRALTDALEASVGTPVERCLVVSADMSARFNTIRAVLFRWLQPSAQLDLKRWCESGESGDTPPDSPYDIILFIDPPWGRCAIRPLDWARLRVRDGGVLCVAGESAHLPPAEPCASGTTVLPYLEAQARRCGFGALQYSALADTAAKCREHVDVDATPAHAPELSSKGMPPLLGRNVHGLVSRQAAELTSEDNPNLSVLWCRKERSPRWEVRPLEANHAEAMRALFAEVFAPNRMSPAHWNWKYGEGRGLGITAWSGGRMIAFYGGIPREISFRGRTDQAMQIVDVMVHAGERGVLRREGAFFLTAATFLECHLGYGTASALGYGFPTARALKVAERLGLYEAVDSVFELSWPCQVASAGWRYRVTWVDGATLQRHQRAIDRLWVEMRAGLSDAIVGSRDWGYVRRRFLDHPDKAYEYLVLRRGITGRALALLVLTIESETCHLRDYVGDIRWLGTAIQLLRGYAATRGLTQLSTRITSGFVDCFPTEARRDEAMDIAIPHNAWSRGVDAEEVRGRWWLMSGDTDFL